MARDVFVFRQIDVGASLQFGASVATAHLPFWFLIALASAAVVPALSGAFFGPRPSILGRALLFFLAGLWPLGAAARAALNRIDGKSVGANVLADAGAVTRLFLPVALVVTVAAAGGFAFEGVVALLFGGGPTLFSSLGAPLTTMGIMRLYPLVCLGAISVAMPMSLAPWVAVDKGLGVSSAMEWAGRLSKDVKMELMFLQGTIFFTVSVTFLLCVLAGAKTFPENVVTFFFQTEAFVFVAGFWTEAYRQALAYEAPEEAKSLPSAARRVYRVS